MPHDLAVTGLGICLTSAGRLTAIDQRSRRTAERPRIADPHTSSRE